MSYPPSPCPSWCKQRHAEPDMAHARDLGTAGPGLDFVLAASLIGDAERDFLRLYVHDETGDRFYDLADDIAEHLGRALREFPVKDLRHLGGMLAHGGRLLREEEGR
ncbi:hypothetical protein [Sphaerisporangium dianthi]|uniref:Uncharacterized protein n=1 Tax=Sphaerisporangium dianthi TaxID=1436120 RepID=A0ABV9CQZ8_9ACTN